jgi:hypothetical protein
MLRLIELVIKWKSVGIGCVLYGIERAGRGDIRFERVKWANGVNYLQN